jgi:xanthine dehydrogenase FAD-binding subunit
MPELRFEMPSNLPELAECLAGAGDDTRLLGGGTDLLLQLPALRFQGTTLIDLSGMRELSEMRFEKDVLEIGANVTYARIAQDPFIRSRIPCLAAMAARIGSPQIRNCACLPGNLVNASPGGDAIGTILALDARVRLLNGAGAIRECAIDELVLGIGKTSLSRNEAIIGVRIPIPASPWNAYGKIGLTPRREVIIANVSLTMVFEITEPDRRIRAARMVLGSTSPRAHRVSSAEALCVDQVPSSELAREVAEALKRDVAGTIGANPAFQHKLNDVRGLALDLFHELFALEL